LHYPHDQLFDEPLQYQGKSVLDKVADVDANNYYCNLTATRIEGVENIEKIDILTPTYATL
jgi:hypothetical protein